MSLSHSESLGAANHAALWVVGPDMPGLLNVAASFVRDRGGNIDRNIAHKFGENCVIFMSISADPPDIDRMDQEKMELKRSSGCNVKFQPMLQPTVPNGFRNELYGFDILTRDSKGLLAELTSLVSQFGMFIIGHTGERYIKEGPRPVVQVGQKVVVMMPHEFDQLEFSRQINDLAKRHRGTVKTPLRSVPGLLWWW